MNREEFSGVVKAFAEFVAADLDADAGEIKAIEISAPDSGPNQVTVYFTARSLHEPRTRTWVW